ncbi:MAG: site-2 protease family protein, partial [Mycobacteriaceae bacterium]
MVIPFSRSHQSAIRPSPIFLGIIGLALAGGALAWVSDYGSMGSKAGAFIMVFAGWVVTLCLHE